MQREDGCKVDEDMIEARVIVANTDFEYKRQPASLVTCSIESGLAGSAGVTCVTDRVLTAITPIEIHPRRACPTTTVLAQPLRIQAGA